MELRHLDLNALREVYHTRLIADFPPDERKPLWAVELLREQGQYDTLGFYEGDALLAYAFLWRDREGLCVLLDYLAVCREVRGRGLGAACLDLLEEHYRSFAGILVEAEALEDGVGEGENALRLRRIDFYRRNGFRVLDYSVRLFGVYYTVLASGTLRKTDALAAHRRHYRWGEVPNPPERMTEIPCVSPTPIRKVTP